MTNDHSIKQLQDSILCVEDDPISRSFIYSMVSHFFPDLSVYQAQNGQAGLELFLQHRPRVIITDCTMPVMDGITMVREMKNAHPDTFVIMLTGFDKRPGDNQPTDTVIDHYMRKPVDFEELENVVHSVLSAKSR